MSRPAEEKKLIRMAIAVVAMHAMITANKPWDREQIAQNAFKQADVLLNMEEA